MAKQTLTNRQSKLYPFILSPNAFANEDRRTMTKVVEAHRLTLEAIRTPSQDLHKTSVSHGRMPYYL